MLAVAVTLGLPLAALFVGVRSHERLESTKSRGDQIVQAIERFHADHGHYPDSLDELSPRYLDTIPAPTWGLEVWKYDVIEAGTVEFTFEDEFVLGVDESIRTGDGQSRWLEYDKGLSRWHMGD